MVDHSPKVVFAFPTRQSTNGKARNALAWLLIPVLEPRQTQLAQSTPGRIQMALKNGKEILSPWIPVCRDTPVVPSQRPKGGDPKPLLVRLDGRNDIVQLHDDIGTNLILTLCFCPYTAIETQHLAP
jgi:hypothetical protein